ncbi:LysM peptidoglycan-binding domain-containing protein [Sporosarcina pasteurii]|uniref:Elastin-binding protein ebpS n=1 Tax=Sporosarcina pasteurii TaxID=1474 RepID=A0A380BK98_SPOPA|nr:LysM peptidoglycan-binding domain-containing protein [Sporosarcina pasteurii]MDS9470800.1 LysM peptidoglycan-binding domain-containing protein [Sporosarcina pasteurii]SUJ02352.1 Elastin-binding protein ebpS [Sporosarcina pasteurii]
MKKDDYRTEFEEQRKEIKLDGETDSGKPLSRVDLHSKKRKPKKRSRYSLINVLLVLFTLIPIGILAFVIISWNSPNDNIASKLEESQFQFEKSKKTDENSVTTVNKEKEPEDDKKDEKTNEQIEAEEKAKEEAERAKAEAEAEEKRKEEAARQQAEKEKQQAQAEERAKENDSTDEQKSQARTHVVAPGETLYRISVNYYKSGDGVNKIMQANSLTTNEISVGQKLIIP